MLLIALLIIINAYKYVSGQEMQELWLGILTALS